MFKFIKNDQNNVFKGLRDNGYETIIKSVDEVSNKSTIFISSSIGCPLKCKFCHLTIKNYKYHPVSEDEIIWNAIKTFLHSVKHNPTILDKKIKLAWMGAGDPFFNLEKVKIVSNQLIELLPCELDRVDLSTAFPAYENTEFLDMMDYKILRELMKCYNSKIFYSLFSVEKQTKNFMMPKTENPYKAIEKFNHFTIPFHLHQTFIDNVNDSDQELEALIKFVDSSNAQSLRILRYNSCNESWFYQSDKFDKIKRRLEKEIKIPLKFQISPGDDIKAACGMFG